MNFHLPTFDDIRRWFSTRLGRSPRARRYEGARFDRTTRDWPTHAMSTNFELRRDLRALRARAKWLAKNDDHVKRFLSLVRTNVPGPDGIKLQVRARNDAGELDRILNRSVELAWATWSHPENCALNGRYSWVGAQRKFATMLARDGEAVVRLMAADNPFGFALKFYSADWLDEMFCDYYRDPVTGRRNRVIMSVEVDDNDKPVAYWLTTPPSELLFRHNHGARYRTRVPASEMIHAFLPDDENADDDGQVRGVPWVHTAMKRLRHLVGYEEAVIIAARVAACQSIWIKEEGVEEYTGEEDNEGTKRRRPLQTSLSPGNIGLLDSDQELVEFKPNQPTANHEEFINAELRGAAAGLDVAPFSLTGNYGEINFSAGRLGVFNERDGWRSHQNFMGEHFCRPVFLAWLRSSMMTGALKIQPADYYRLAEPLWKGRGWKGIQPLEEARANQINVALGVETVTEIVAERGGDIEEKLDTRAAELALADEKGVKLSTDAKLLPDEAAGGEGTPPEK